MKTKISDYLDLVKFSHTVFALPFAMVGYMVGVSHSGFNAWDLVGVILCMVLARSAAMAFNRIVDRSFDARNARTASREIPAGKITVSQAVTLVIVCCVGFVAVAASLNPLTGMLAPVALAVVLGYSYTKRFTALCHLVLGIGISIAPTAAYLAVTGHFDVVPVLLSVMVMFWIAGFDIIFALQDVEFDRGAGLHSIPAFCGIGRALSISSLLHLAAFFVAMAIAWLLVTTIGAQVWLVVIGTACFGTMLLYQHLILSPGDLSRLNLAFGTTNGVASVIYAIFVILSLLLV